VGLDRLCRYVTRSAICLERLTTSIDGKVSYKLKHPFRDGTPHILFTPQDFLAALRQQITAFGNRPSVGERLASSSGEV